MSDDGFKALHAEFLKGQAQFAYFLLGVAASAIAFAIHHTTGRILAETPWPYGAASALWAISFATGCFGLTSRQEGIVANANFLKAMREVGPGMRQFPEVSQMIREAEVVLENSSSRPIKRFGWQLWTFFLGAIFFVVGHIIDLARTGAAVSV